MLPDMPADLNAVSRVILLAEIEQRFAGNVSDAAKAWGVPQTTLNAFMAGGGMRLETLGVIVEALGLDVVRFFRAYPAHALRSGAIVETHEVRAEAQRVLRRDQTDRLMDLLHRLNALGVTDDMLSRLEDATAIAEAAVASKERRPRTRPIRPRPERGK